MKIIALFIALCSFGLSYGQNIYQPELCLLKPDIWYVLDIEFQIGGGSYPMLEYAETFDSLSKYLQRNPQYDIEIEIHTDPFGSASTNMKLSELRGNALHETLSHFGLDSSRIECKAFGETVPFVIDSAANAKYPFFPIGLELTYEYIRSLEKERKKMMAALELSRRTLFVLRGKG